MRNNTAWVGEISNSLALVDQQLQHLQTIKQKIESWVGANRIQIVRGYDEGKFRDLEEFRDRTIDITQPLDAILEVAYQGDPKAEAIHEEFLQAVIRTRDEQETTDHETPPAQSSQ